MSAGSRPDPSHLNPAVVGDGLIVSHPELRPEDDLGVKNSMSPDAVVAPPPPSPATYPQTSQDQTDTTHLDQAQALIEEGHPDPKREQGG